MRKKLNTEYIRDPKIQELYRKCLKDERENKRIEKDDAWNILEHIRSRR